MRNININADREKRETFMNWVNVFSAQRLIIYYLLLVLS